MKYLLASIIVLFLPSLTFAIGDNSFTISATNPTKITILVSDLDKTIVAGTFYAFDTSNSDTRLLQNLEDLNPDYPEYSFAYTNDGTEHSFYYSLSATEIIGSYQAVAISGGSGENLATDYDVLNYCPTFPTDCPITSWRTNQGNNHFISIPNSANMTASLSFGAIGIYSDMLPIALIICGILLGLLALNWVVKWFKPSVIEGHEELHDGSDWMLHIKSEGHDALYGTGLDDSADLGKEEDLDA